MQPDEIVNKIMIGEDLSTTVANALASNAPSSRRDFLGFLGRSAKVAASHAIEKKAGVGMDKMQDIANLARHALSPSSASKSALTDRLKGIAQTAATNIAKDSGKSRIGGFLSRFVPAIKVAT